MLMKNPALNDLITKQLNEDAQRNVEHARFVRDLISTNKAPSWRLPLGSFWRDLAGLILPESNAKVALGGLNLE